jgi:osmotically inducible lipoprotein OsmB
LLAFAGHPRNIPNPTFDAPQCSVDASALLPLVSGIGNSTDPQPEGFDMRKLMILPLMLPLLACNPNNATDRTVGGAAIGAGAGAIIGGVASGTAGGALAGAAIGGVGGAIIGNATTPRNCYAYDRYGRRILVSC